LVFPLLHNGPIYYFALLALKKEVIFEQHDNYVKQSYRNRCNILGPNGKVTLTVPVKKIHGRKTPYREVLVDNEKPWKRIHWKSLTAAYAASPYFQYMIDDLRPCYEREIKYLIDLNTGLLNAVLKYLNLDLTFRFSESFSEIREDKDPRMLIHPKKNPESEDPLFRIMEYHQVFSERHGFQPNLSILDLMFNMGPEATTLLLQSFRT